MSRYRSYHGASVATSAMTGDQRRLPVGAALCFGDVCMHVCVCIIYIYIYIYIYILYMCVDHICDCMNVNVYINIYVAIQFLKLSKIINNPLQRLERLGS